VDKAAFLPPFFIRQILRVFNGTPSQALWRAIQKEDRPQRIPVVKKSGILIFQMHKVFNEI
jgi:hypothetical protein